MSRGVEFSVWQPTRVIFGRGSLDRVGELASGVGSHALVITGRGFARRYGYDERIKKLLEEHGVRASFFQGVEPNPTYTTVEKCLEVARTAGVDVFVAFGGGSVVDVAKAVNVTYTLGGRVSDYVYPKSVNQKLKPLIAIPTTHGTGSEVTKYSVLVDEASKMKVAISGDGLYPDYALLDPEVLKHLPRDQSASTGLDALSHAIEAFFSRRSTPYSDILSLEAARIAFRYLPCAVSGVLECREKMLYASMLAGLAINYTGTNVGHGLGYTLTVELGIPHGLANAMILPGAARFYEAYMPERAETFFESIGVSRPAGGLGELLQSLKASIGAPLRLRELGVPEERLEHFVRDGLRYQRNLLNSPFEITEDVAREIYRLVY
ncbi:iron-containing alcohol dehydrogenase [Infirmifilum lucidum]|uniref:Iron-containing alcohol dehydrogenase n=1 Tax=Infirmifilum lucidum TaxID=2776706 RepID=A0A7L9FI59_9CREN|nr:iron-containing alcohol dehydrogenase [Infirmifilum lucidum]QOJ79397.1 iron-containing alcohol dehydrogenase [Infirmifilum lucidum]